MWCVVCDMCVHVSPGTRTCHLCDSLDRHNFSIRNCDILEKSMSDFGGSEFETCNVTSLRARAIVFRIVLTFVV